MTAWVLVIAISVTQTITVPGIASENECERLAQRFRTTVTLPVPGHKCFDYRTVEPPRTEIKIPDLPDMVR